MSKWTGKSDFCDWCEMHNSPKDIVERADIYLGNAKVEIKSERDLIPYYTNLISSMGCTKDGPMSIHLSKDSFINYEEIDFLTFSIIEAIKLARKAKKEKVPFTFELIKGNIDKFDITPRYSHWKAIINTINSKPEILKLHIQTSYNERDYFIHSWVHPRYFSSIHLPRFNKQREDFLEFCSENGFNTIKSMGEDKIYHPLLSSMGYLVTEYYKQEKEFGDGV